ncbi:fumarylacetoacetate hydrolase family protein [Micromonospora marina]|uniref:2-keto-4-pentenoate hydratase/2-oxohepta-3-ene-1,7-dioic acid hydratase (Catechol pathway) n=1 Tax=Micromonospora marina TaxID=307120 RepID=A0A1C4ZC34_9ACTN|nr:fumarylacetoacetate hydrolase family protein [Micromonospora marina]SCF30562.1 2-keto-4-pentenoate hydratase/2-oxohepta-3-ene-1,7-dioic acid hydratase (catechol pathway) [Micromonospora marina]
MRLMRVGPRGGERPVLLAEDGRHLDLAGLTGDIDGAFLAGDGIQRARAALDAGGLPEIDVSGMRVGAPIARPGTVACIGLNYARHAAESGVEPPAEPVVFLKATNTVVGPYDDIVLPRRATRTDWEVELAVVIGRSAHYLDSPADAADVIAGYTVSNDLSEREFQMSDSGGQWAKGKSCESFNPLGPWLVTADEVDDPQNLALSSRVNGEQRQASSTSDMVFDVYYLVWYLSQYLALEPGDVVNTGTPEGVAMSGRFPYLTEGDVMSARIEGLGEQRQTCRAARP